MELISTLPVKKFNSNGVLQEELDFFAIEKPVALIYNGISHVVMMATPKDLTYFAIGFSLTENIIHHPSEIYAIEEIETQQGVEVHIELSSRQFMALKEKRRNLTGRTGCGICGSEQLSQICQIQTPLPFTALINLNTFAQSVYDLKTVQIIGRQTGCTHAAIWLDLNGNFIAGFEDIGRHVALDKLLGYRAKQENQQGVIVVSSRASYEMVQKVASCGIEVLLAVSAATSLAIEVAQRSNLTLVAFFRGDKGMICSHPSRIL